MNDIFARQLNKFIIGGANLGQKYGLINKKKQKNGLLKNLWNLGFRKIDLSNGYHGSEQVVINSGLPWAVQYKIVLPEFRNYVYKDLKEFIKIKLDKLKIGDNFRLLIHNTDYVLGAYPKEIFLEMKEMAIQLGVDQFGISTYTREEYDLVKSRTKLDVVQFPYNILDTRFLDLSNKSEASGVIYQARSIFLQGLLLKVTGTENWFWRFPEFVNWTNYLKITGRSALECCLLKVVNNPLIDEIVVGVDDERNVTDLIKALQCVGSKHEDFYQLNCQNLYLIDPRKWIISEN